MRNWLSSRSPEKKRALNKAPEGTTPTRTGLHSPISQNVSHPDIFQDFISDANFSPGPKIKPYAFSQTQPVNLTQISRDTKCFICDEDITVSFSDERSVLLKCGDVVHGECFDVLMLKDQGSGTPLCHGMNCSSLEIQIEPVDVEVMQKAIAARSKLNSSKKPWTPKRSSSSYSLPGSSRTSVNKQSVLLKGSSLADNMSMSLYSEVFSHIVRETSPAPTEISQRTVSIRIEANRGISFETLSNRFIKYLVEHNRNFPISSILHCGRLRLVDSLRGTSLPQERDLPSNFIMAYLFEHSLLVWFKNMNQTLILNLAETKFKILLTNSVLKVESVDQKGTPHELWLASECPAIIEKWVIALSDFSFSFPSEFVTSTLVDLVELDGRTSKLLSPVVSDFPLEDKLNDFSKKNVIREEEEDEYYIGENTSYYKKESSISPLISSSLREGNMISGPSPRRSMNLSKDRQIPGERMNSSLYDNIALPRRRDSAFEQFNNYSYEHDLESDLDLILYHNGEETEENFAAPGIRISQVSENQIKLDSPISFVQTLKEGTSSSSHLDSKSKTLQTELFSDTDSNFDNGSDSDSEADSDEEVIMRYRKSNHKVPSGWSDLLVCVDTAIVNSI